MVTDSDVIQLRARIEELEAQVAFLYKHLGTAYVAGPRVEDQQLAKVIEQIKKGNTLEAIRVHRQLFDSDLVTAKRAVEDLQKSLGR